MPEARGTRPKLLMIGIDAGDIGWIKDHLDALPSFRALFAESEPQDLQSTAATLSSSVWPTFASGTMPGHHGVFYPMQWDHQSQQLRRVTDEWLYYEPFWYELARQGLKVTVLDAPFTFSSRLDEGIEVQNWGSQECLGPFEGNRPELIAEIKRRFGSHPMGHDIPLEEPTKKLATLRDNLVAGAKKKGELARFLMAQQDWDLFLTVFAEAHRGGHILWPDSPMRKTPVPDGALQDVYAAIDAAIGHILDGVDPAETTICVFSVHGMTANYTQEHYVPQVMDRVNAAFRGEQVGQDDDKPEGGGGLMRMLREAVPDQAQYLVARMMPASVRDWVVKRAFTGGLDWKTTCGFTLVASGEGYLRYNLQGREPEGSLEPGSHRYGEYDSLLRESFLGLQTEKGEPVVREVAAPAELYPGPRQDYLPDRIICWNDVLPVDELRSVQLGTMHAHHGTGRGGDHRPGGFAVLTGDRSGLAAAPGLEHIVDFAAFVRGLLLPA